MTKMPSVILAGVLAAAVPALAAENYQFDKAHTTVGFQIRHIFTMVSGKFTDFSGTIQVDRANPEKSSVEFTIQAKSIDTSEPRRDDDLRSANFFDIANHPTITFKSTSVKANGKESFARDGRPHDARSHQAGHAAGDAARRGQGPLGQREDGPRDGRSRSTARTSVSPGTRPSRAAACWWATK